MPIPAPPEKPKDRFEVYRFFNGLSTEGKSGLDEGRTRIPLVKTFLLEHVSGRSNRKPRQPSDIFRDLKNDIIPVDDTFLSVRAPVKQEPNQPPKFNTNKDGSHGQQEEAEEEEDGQEVIGLARDMRAV